MIRHTRPWLLFFSLALISACGSGEETPPQTASGAAGTLADAGGGGSAAQGGGGDPAGQGGVAAGLGGGGQGGGGAGQGGSIGGGAGAAGQASGSGGSGGSAGDAGAGGDSGAAGAAGDGGSGDAGTAGTAGEAGSGGDAGAGGDAGQGGDGGAGGSSGVSGQSGAAGAGGGCGKPVECDLAREQATEGRFEAALNDEGELALFLSQMPKGADLHNHLSGSVYAETFLAWAKEDGYCINTNTKAAVFPNQCSSSTQPTPSPGPFYDSIVRAWSMLDFVPGPVSGHDHFFSTFGKFGAVAGAHRDESIADFLQRSADENVQHIETMFNNGRNVGTLAASIFSGTVSEDKLEGFYSSLLAHPSFAGELQKDIQAVNSAAANYRNLLGCAGPTPPGACGVSVRFIAQVSRTGANDQIFGQLVAAFEMAAKTPHLVGVNLSSPEDDVASLKNYTLHMQMLDFLHKKYTLPGKSPLRVTLHAGELTAKYLPPGYEDALTFHIRQAVELGHAERIGHGIAILSETDSAGLLAEMAKRKVLVEVCLSSNIQILEVSGPAHPLSAYLANKVPVTLASDDLGVSRSSLAGEYLRGATAQKLSYKQLKRMARESLEHAFLPGDSLWSSLDDAAPVAPCAPTDQAGLGEELTPACKGFLDQSERAAAQWELERRLRVFESDG